MSFLQSARRVAPKRCTDAVLGVAEKKEKKKKEKKKRERERKERMVCWVRFTRFAFAAHCPADLSVGPSSLTSTAFRNGSILLMRDRVRRTAESVDQRARSLVFGRVGGGRKREREEREEEREREKREKRERREKRDQGKA